MQHELFSSHINQQYGVQPEYLWAKFPEFAVFRHSNNRKWFAILMNVAANKIGLAQHYPIWIANLKAQPETIGSLRMMQGIYPAYHMNKEHWISVHLQEIDKMLLWQLVEDSFRLTAKK
ncbi:MmcQ/YjbR family DNA-binding protein [Avibacterium paragallinarum]|uniref:MmcQ/YjbR family DNA-binding protein n=1 Tax=Avibacterium paragallinarum TaxID=728 RepID=UPI00397B6DEA